MSRIITWIILILPLLLTSCGKDELTQPAKVSFEIELIPHEESNDQKSRVPPHQRPFTGPFNKLIIDRGTLIIESISFEGRRDEGRDVFFTSDLKDPVIADLKTGGINQELIFDIPQGVYNQIDLFIDLGSEEMTPLVLEGRIRNKQSEEIPVRFEYNFREWIRIRAEPGNKGNRIVLKKEDLSRARIVFDAGSAFQFANLQALEAASVAISVTDDQELLIISDRINTNIFNSVANRLEKSFRVVFD